MKKIFLLSFCFALFSNCTKEVTCSDQQICTMMFAYITLEIIAPPSMPLPAVDSFATTRVSDGKVILTNSEYLLEYPIVFTDAQMFDTSVKGEQFLFEAFKDGQKVVSENYVIKHDCCHVIKVSGKDTILL